MPRVRFIALTLPPLLALLLLVGSVSLAAPGSFGEIGDPAVFSPYAVRLGFDEQAPGSHISSQYAALGLRIDDPPESSAVVIATGPGASSASHALANRPASGPSSAGQPLVLRFDPPVGRVGLEMGNGQGAMATLRAYTATGDVIGVLTRATPTASTAFFGLYSTANDIAAVALDYGESANGETIDDLTFERWRPARRLAYLYDHDADLAATWLRWLVAQGFDASYLSLDEAGEADLAAYSLLLIGPDTGSANDWGNPQLVERILAADTRVLGLGEGGYAFLGRAGALIGWPAGAHTTASAIRTSCAQPDLGIPRPLVADSEGQTTLYDQPGSAVVVPIANPPAQLRPLASVPDAPAFWPVLREGDRLALWGFALGPDRLTGDGRAAFLNLIDYLHRPLPLPDPAAVDTLVLTACERMTDIGYEASQVQAMIGQVGALVQSSPVATNMIAIHRDVGLAPAAVRASFDAWAGHEGEVGRTNAAVAAIDGWIESLRQQTYPNLKNLILVGGHEVLPMQARPADNYDEDSWPLPQNSGYLFDLYRAGSAGHYLTDAPYADLSTVADGWGNEGVLRPELAVGRLVETPAQIGALIATYLEAEAYLADAGRLAAGSSDFMDGARAAAEAMGPGADAALIQPGFTSAQLPPAMTASPNILFLAGHGDYNWITTRKWDQGFRSGASATQGDVSDLGDLPNAVVVAAGCHNGVNFGNQLYHAPTADPTFADFPEAFAARRVGVYLAATGYTWVSLSEDSDDPAYALYSEQLAALFIRQLLHGGYRTAGRAWLAAVDDYLAAAGPGALNDGGHRRVLATTTFYGFPTYRWRRPFLPPNAILRPLPGEFWWDETVLEQSQRTLRIRYELRLPPLADSLQASGVAGMPTAGGLNQPLRPIFSLAPLLPEGSQVLSVEIDGAQSQARLLPGPIPVPALGNHDVSFRPRWASVDFFPASSVEVQGGTDQAVRLRINPVQRRSLPVASSLASAPADLVAGETLVWERLVFTVSYRLGLSGDEDGDGLPAYWEMHYGFDDGDASGDNGAAGDPDGDGVDNAGELALKTDPLDPDSDHDGASDGWEAENGVDPANPGEGRRLLYLPFLRTAATG
ncbi:MAG: hypothetical protein K1X65_18815 [Caldilineales bacterium]|nr:hypothetical protein [Caldilineales bacterium]